MKLIKRVVDKKSELGQYLNLEFELRRLRTGFNDEDAHFRIELTDDQVTIMYMEHKLRLPNTDKVYKKIDNTL